jgi:hypothetical protein
MKFIKILNQATQGHYTLAPARPPISLTQDPKEVNHGIWNNAQIAAIDNSSLTPQQRADLALGKSQVDKDGNTWMKVGTNQLAMKPAGK